MRIKFLALATLAALTISSAQAETGQAHTWTLHDVVFDDLTTATGTFSVDALANLTSFDITTQQAGDFPITHYTSTDSLFAFESDSTDIFIYSSSGYLLFKLLSPDNSNVASVGVDYGTELFGPPQEAHYTRLSVDRYFSGGSITTSVSSVPEPETYALMLAGLSALSHMARRRKTL